MPFRSLWLLPDIQLFFSKMPKSTLGRPKGLPKVHFCPPKNHSRYHFCHYRGSIMCNATRACPLLACFLFLVCLSNQNKELGANLTCRHQKGVNWPSFFTHNHTRRRPTKSALSAGCVKNGNSLVGSLSWWVLLKWQNLLKQLVIHTQQPSQ